MIITLHDGSTMRVAAGASLYGMRIVSFEFTYHERAKAGAEIFDKWVYHDICTRFKINSICQWEPRDWRLADYYGWSNIWKKM